MIDLIVELELSIKSKIDVTFNESNVVVDKII